jgi:mannose-6-phosphate isomerase-like protein (cupin superfamily)
VKVQSWEPDELRFEPAYNVRGVRLQRLDGAEEPYEGGAWVVVEPGTTATSHVNPDGESEIFFIVQGSGEVEVDGDRRRVKFGDGVFIPPHQEHLIVNDTADPLVFLSLWWGGQPAEGR